MTEIERDGFNKGLVGNTVERGLMRLGLACAGDSQTEINTRAWLDAFDKGDQVGKQAQHIVEEVTTRGGRFSVGGMLKNEDSFGNPELITVLKKRRISATEEGRALVFTNEPGPNWGEERL